MLTSSDGKPWTSDGFRASWRKACAAAGVVGVTFHDLRGTAVTRLAIGNATEAEIATITGTLAAKRARDPRRALPCARSGAWRERDQEARNRNQISQLTSQLLLAGLVGNWKTLCGHWWAHQDSNLGPAD
jgi:hypothetical protein